VCARGYTGGGGDFCEYGIEILNFIPAGKFDQQNNYGLVQDTLRTIELLPLLHPVPSQCFPINSVTLYFPEFHFNIILPQLFVFLKQAVAC